MTLLARLKLLCGIAEENSSDDETLMLLISQAKEYVKDYCHLKECGTEHDPLVLSVAAEDWSKLGSGGIAYKSISGAYESYRSGYSDSVMAQLRAKRKPSALQK